MAATGRGVVVAELEARFHRDYRLAIYEVGQARPLSRQLPAASGVARAAGCAEIIRRPERSAFHGRHYVVHLGGKSVAAGHTYLTSVPVTLQYQFAGALPLSRGHTGIGVGHEASSMRRWVEGSRVSRNHCGAHVGRQVLDVTQGERHHPGRVPPERSGRGRRSDVRALAAPFFSGRAPAPPPNPQTPFLASDSIARGSL
jgi:hypothetical protein